MSDPDSIVEYVKWLDGRHNRLVNAVAAHRSNKTHRAIPGAIDDFDRNLWKALEAARKEQDDD
jgi:hypothetical protein